MTEEQEDQLTFRGDFNALPLQRDPTPDKPAKNGDVYEPPRLLRTDSVTNYKVKTCRGCKTPMDSDSNQWATLCYACYKKVVRKCKHCNSNLPLNCPVYKTSCHSCYTVFGR